MSVLDIGAGTGRHAIYLASLGARVHAIDCSAVACRLHTERLMARGLKESVTIENAIVDLNDLPDGRYDLIIDSYVSCHILSAAERRAFLSALVSRLAPQGRLYTAGMGDTDTYYRRHLFRSKPDAIAVDPLNDISKLLQPTDIAARDDADISRVLASTTEVFVEAVAGVAERRAVHAAVLTR